MRLLPEDCQGDRQAGLKKRSGGKGFDTGSFHKRKSSREFLKVDGEDLAAFLYISPLKI